MSSDPPEDQGRSPLSGKLWKALEKSIDAGLQSISKADEFRQALTEGKGRELAQLLAGHVDEFKQTLSDKVADEVRRYLSKVDLTNEVHKALSDMTIHVSAEINLTPRTPGDKDAGKAAVRVSTQRRKPPHS